jgi:hypothetical protein
MDITGKEGSIMKRFAVLGVLLAGSGTMLPRLAAHEPTWAPRGGSPAKTASARSVHEPEFLEPPLPEPVNLNERISSQRPCQSDGLCDTWSPGRRVANHWRTVTKPHLQYTHWGYADQFEVRPFGTYMRGAVNTQIANGLTAQSALYRYDFLDEAGDPTDELSPRGAEQLEKMLHFLSFGECVVTIEPSGEGRELDEARRANVLAQFHQLGLALGDNRVIVARPLARGLHSDEAAHLQYNAIQNFGSGATSGSAINPASGPGTGVGAAPSTIAPVMP